MTSRRLLVVGLLLFIFIDHAKSQALIVVDAQIGLSGCDLREAIIAAETNSNSHEPLCIRGLSDEPEQQDTIVFDPDLFGDPDEDNVVLNYPAFNCLNPDVNASAAYPTITSGIFIFGRSNQERIRLLAPTGQFDENCRIFYIDGGNLRIQNLFLGPALDFRGGAINVNNDGMLTAINVSFVGNTAQNFGGAIAASDAEVKISFSEFIDNVADSVSSPGFRASSGAIDLGSSNAIIEDSHFQGNRTLDLPSNQGQGGAIQVVASNLTLLRTSFIENISADSGAINVNNGTSVLIQDSTFSRNRAEDQGGSAIGAIGSGISLTIINSTITENVDANDFSFSSGAIDLAIGSEADDPISNILIRNSIVSGNTASISASIGQEIRASGFDSEVTPNTLVIDNSIVGSSSLTTNQGLNIDGLDELFGIFLPERNNQIGFSDSADIPLRSIIGPRRFGSTAGSSTSFVYHPLVRNSPAIDAGADVVSAGSFPLFFIFPGCRDVTGLSTPGPYRPDQLGRERPQGAECDIGAIEFVDEPFCWAIPLPNGRAVTPCL